MKLGVKVSTPQGEVLIARTGSEEDTKRVCRELELKYPGVNFYAADVAAHEPVVESEYFPLEPIYRSTQQGTTWPNTETTNRATLTVSASVNAKTGKVTITPKKKAVAKAKKK